MKYPFPFIGAGQCVQYTSWFRFYIIFKDIPDIEAKRLIKQHVPKPIKITTRSYKGNTLIVFQHTGELFTWCKSNGIEVDKTMGKRELIDKVFSEKISKWLLQVHNVFPLEAVCRIEDAQFSEWHGVSGEMLRSIIEKWMKEEETHKEAIAVTLAYAIRYYFMQDPLALRIIENCRKIDFFFHLIKGDEDIPLMRTKEAEQGLFNVLPQVTFKQGCRPEVIMWAIRLKSERLKKGLYEHLKKASKTDLLSLEVKWRNTYNIVETGFTEELAEIYWMLMDVLEVTGKEPKIRSYKDKDWSIFNNILVSCGSEAHSGVSRERVKRAIKIGEKYAPDNPLMYWNTFELQCEINDFQGALVNVKKYFKSEDANITMLKKEIKKSDKFSTFRNFVAGGTFVKSLE